MNIKYALIAATLLAFGTTAYAQDTTIGSNSSTQTQTQAASNSNNGGVYNNLVTNNPGTVDYKGGFKTVPSAVVGAFSNSFSTDYCYGTAQIGASWLGGSVSGGKPVLDTGCELLRSSDMLMRISVQIHAEASEEYKLALNLEGQIVQMNQKIQVTPHPYENKTTLTVVTPPETTAQKETGEAIQNMKLNSYQKNLQGDELETAAVYNVCKIGDDERASLESAGFHCPAKQK
jgi:hypothetical protein